MKECRDQTSSAEAIFKKKLYKDKMESIHDKASMVKLTKSKYDGFKMEKEVKTKIPDTINILQKKTAEINEITEEHTVDDEPEHNDILPLV